MRCDCDCDEKENTSWNILCLAYLICVCTRYCFDGGERAQEDELVIGCVIRGIRIAIIVPR